MPAFSNLLDACNAVGDIATARGLGLLAAEDTILNGRTVRVDGQDLLHFGSCSALGLELDPRVVEGAVDAARRFGAQFSASRAFVSAPPYAELEERLGEITGGSVLVTPNTTLASFSALPSLIEEEDLVILDQQVHATVQLVVPLLQQIGARVEFIRRVLGAAPPDPPCPPSPTSWTPATRSVTSPPTGVSACLQPKTRS